MEKQNKDADDTLDFLEIIAQAAEQKPKKAIKRDYCETYGRMANQWKDRKSANAHVKKIGRGYAFYCHSCGSVYHVMTDDGII